MACLAKDRDVLLAFYDFPAEHRKHIRTTNPIESTFATVRLRTTKTKGCLSRMTALTMVFKLCQSASKKWRRLDGSHQIADIIQGVKFKDGEKLPDRAKVVETIRRTLSNLGAIVSGLAEIRNLYGTGHGKHGKHRGLSARHAKLAAGAAGTLAVFLFETHQDRP